MNGVFHTDGKYFFINHLVDYANTSGLYVGLLTNTYPADLDSSVGSGIVELSASGYERKSSPLWTTISGVSPIAQGSTVQWQFTGTWSGVYGYFVSPTASGEISYWSEFFPYSHRGDVGTENTSSSISVLPRYQLIDKSEI